MSIETANDTASSRKTHMGRTRLTVAAAALCAAAILGTACQPATPREAVKQRWGSLYACTDRIIQRESGWNPAAVSPGGGNIGLFQLNQYHKTWIRNELGYTWNQLKEPAKNAHAAKVLYDKAARQYGDGWQPWRLSGKAIRGGGCPA